MVDQRHIHPDTTRTREALMAEVLLFHHAMGQTDGFHAFADELRHAGHTVHTPDLFDGRTFDSIEEGMAFAESLGFPDEIIARGERAAGDLPNDLVYAGFSLGVVPAQKLAQTRPGARGAAVLFVRSPQVLRRRMAAGRACPDPRDGRRPVLRRRGRHRRRA
jgi:esterase/lipase